MSYCQFPSRHPALLPQAEVLYRYECEHCGKFVIKAVCEECFLVKVKPLIDENRIHVCLSNMGGRHQINTQDAYAKVGAA